MSKPKMERYTSDKDISPCQYLIGMKLSGVLRLLVLNDQLIQI